MPKKQMVAVFDLDSTLLASSEEYGHEKTLGIKSDDSLPGMLIVHADSLGILFEWLFFRKIPLCVITHGLYERQKILPALLKCCGLPPELEKEILFCNRRDINSLPYREHYRQSKERLGLKDAISISIPFLSDRRKENAFAALWELNGGDASQVEMILVDDYPEICGWGAEKEHDAIFCVWKYIKNLPDVVEKSFPLLDADLVKNFCFPAILFLGFYHIIKFAKKMGLHGDEETPIGERYQRSKAFINYQIFLRIFPESGEPVLDVLDDLLKLICHIQSLSYMVDLESPKYLELEYAAPIAKLREIRREDVLSILSVALAISMAWADNNVQLIEAQRGSFEESLRDVQVLLARLVLPKLTDDVPVLGLGTLFNVSSWPEPEPTEANREVDEADFDVQELMLGKYDIPL